MNAAGQKMREQIIQLEQHMVDPQESTLRNGFHLMAPTGWLNDPNGLCQLGDQYHVFFQYAPYDAKGSGPKGWGHYRTKDWCEFEYMPVPLLPDEEFDRNGVYSGSSFIDDKGMHLFYTGNVKLPGDHDYTTSGSLADTVLVESADGIHFGKKQVVIHTAQYPEGLSCHVRDPKVWKENGWYYMILGARTLQDKGEVLIYRSEDMKQWQLYKIATTQEPFGYMWECPDLLAMPEGQILSVSPQGLQAQEDRYQNQYQTGYFILPDWITHHREDQVIIDENRFREWDKGFDFYAPQSFVDGQGRRILIGWAGMPDAAYQNLETEREGWQHCLTVPRRITLKTNPHTGKQEVYQEPIPELEQLRTGECITVAQKKTVFTSEYMDLLCDGLPDTFEIIIADGVKLQYQDGWIQLSLTEECGCGRDIRKTRIEAVSSLRILIDSSILEIYLNDGEMVFTTRYYKKERGIRLQVSCLESTILAYPMHAVNIRPFNE